MNQRSTLACSPLDFQAVCEAVFDMASGDGMRFGGHCVTKPRLSYIMLWLLFVSLIYPNAISVIEFPVHPIGNNTNTLGHVLDSRSRSCACFTGPVKYNTVYERWPATPGGRVMQDRQMGKRKCFPTHLMFLDVFCITWSIGSTFCIDLSLSLRIDLSHIIFPMCML